MDNKKLFEKWLESFRWNPKEKKLRSKDAIQNYLSHLNNIGKDLGKDEGYIYRINQVSRLSKLEEELKGADNFKARKPTLRYKYLAALHTYRHLVEVLESKKSPKNIKALNKVKIKQKISLKGK